MSQQRHELHIDVDGEANVTVAVVGYKGKGCDALTESIEKSLGTVKKKTVTGEACEREPAPKRKVKA